jgi:hypothetical protein
VSDEIGEYYRDSLTLWLTTQYEGNTFPSPPQPGMSWFFGFPYAFPITRLRFYGWGNLIVNAGPAEELRKSRPFNGWTSTLYWEPSTEQFYGMAQTRKPIKFTYIDPDSFLGCDEDGRLWCFGFNAIGLRTNPPGGRFSSVGLDDDLYPDNVDPIVRVFRGVRFVHVPVYGDKGDVAAQKFVKTGSGLLSSSGNNLPVCFVLNENNELWVAGRTNDNANNSIFESGTILTDATDTTPGDLRFFRKMAITSVYDENMDKVTLQAPLQIADFWCRKPLLILTTDGDLFIHNGQHPLVEIDTISFVKVAGFVKSVEITNGGSGYTSNPTIDVSAPTSANGTKAQFAILRSSEAITDIRIVHPGSGYGSSPPTITFTGGGGSGATATCEIFDENWVSASLTNPSVFGLVAAISESGELYTWGQSSLWGEDSAVWRPERLDTIGYYFNADTVTIPNPNGGNFEYRGYAFPVKAYNPTGNSYSHVSAGSEFTGISHGVLLSENGVASYWGSEGFLNRNTTPDLQMAHYPTLLSDATAIGNKTFTHAEAGIRHVVLLDSDGIAYTYGNGGTQSAYLGQGYFPDQDGSIKQVAGDAKWTRVFAAGRAFRTLATRAEEFDEDGNRVDPLPPITSS